MMLRCTFLALEYKAAADNATETISDLLMHMFDFDPKLGACRLEIAQDRSTGSILDLPMHSVRF